MAECARRRTRLSLCLLLCTLPVLTLSSAHTTWRADCGDGMQIDGCILKNTDCQLSAELAMPENVRNAQPPTTRTVPLTLTPVFTEVWRNQFLDRAFCTEDRWHPSLKITWGTDPDRSLEPSMFFVSIRYRSRFMISKSHCEQCLLLTVNKKRNPTQVQKVQQQILTLFPEDLVQCRDGEQPAHLYVRVHAMEEGPSQTLEKGLTLTQEASISLPTDRSDVPIYGLPTQYRELVPEGFRNMSTLNPLHWTTPLLIYNLSCSRTITVQFQIMPENSYITTYTIYLKSNTSHDYQIQRFQPETSDTFGEVTFYNLTADVYYIQLNISETYYCPSRTDVGIVVHQWDSCSLEESHARCIKPTSGYVTILDFSFCVEPASWSEMKQAVGSRRVVGLSLGAGAAVGALLCLALVWRKYKVKANTHTDPSMTTQRVLILYCMDNLHHKHAVLKFASMLRAHAFCDVTIDEWDEHALHKVSAHEWLYQHLSKADVVIVVGSEGANRLIEARRMGKSWPALEEAFTLGKIFRQAITVLENSIPCTLSKVIGVTFDYTQSTDIGRTFKEVTRESRHYRLMDDLGKFLQYVQKTKDQTEKFHAYSRKMLDTNEGRQLSEAIKCTKEFYHSNPDWFTKEYGNPEPILSHDGFKELNDMKAIASKKVAKDKGSNDQHGCNTNTNAVYINDDVQFQSCHSSNVLLEESLLFGSV